MVTPVNAALVPAETVTPVTGAKLAELKFVGTTRTAPCKWQYLVIDTNGKSWRVRKEGERNDKAFSFTQEDPKVVWKRLVAYCKGQP